MKFYLAWLTLALSPLFAWSQSRGDSFPGKLASPVPMEKLPAPTREAILKVMKAPTVTVLAQAEEFVAHNDVYQWLLDHPDRTAIAWRRLGIEAMDIRCTRDGGFIYKDDQGTEMMWKCVAKSDAGRIWFAEGRVKPGVLIPSVPVQAVAVLRHVEKANPRNADSTIKHQVELFMQTDSKAAAMVTKALGDQAPKMAQAGADQLLAFFSGVAKYAHAKPDKADALFAEEKRTSMQK